MNSLKTKRLHDVLYLKENRYKNPKNNFKFLIKLLSKRVNTKKTFKLLDIGCANGELIWNLKNKFKNIDLYGLDIREDLIKKAKKHCKNVKFFKKDLSKKNLKIGKFDVIIISGVVSCINNPSTVIKNLKNNLSKNGIVFYFDNLSNFKFNTYLQYEDINDKKKVLQSGYNIYSLDTIRACFKSILNVKKIETIPFFINKNVKQNKKKYFTNATNLIQKQYWIIVKT